MYVEYNLINNIPILYPDSSNLYRYAHRYAIADADKLLHCFDREKNIFVYRNTKFRYVKVYINQNIGDVKALFYYVLVDNAIDWDGFDYTDHKKIMRWLKHTKNHYILVTTPVLQHKYQYYSIANDNHISIINHNANELMDDCSMIYKLIDANCYTICDNFSVAISLNQKRICNKSTFVQMIRILNHMKNFYFTSQIWMYLMNQHRIMCACDFPLLYLGTVDDIEIIELFDNSMYEGKIYLQTCYADDILFTSVTSVTSVATNVKYLQMVSGSDDISKCLFVKNISYEEFGTDDQYVVPDFYGIFQAFVTNDDMWEYWRNNKSDIIEKLQGYDFDVLCALFNLYAHNTNDRIREIWNDINIDAQSLNYIFAISEWDIVPYRFLTDIYHNMNIDWGKCQLVYDGRHILRYASLYSILQKRAARDTIYQFYTRILHKRMVYILMCIYKKFCMFSSISVSDHNKYMQGCLILDYLQRNMYYLM